MTLLVDHNGKGAGAVDLRIHDPVPHGGQKQIRPHNRSQSAFGIDRHGTHDADLTGKEIYFHICKDKMSGFHGLSVPGPGARIKFDDAAVFR